MQRLLQLKDPAIIEGGVFPSLAPNQTALWRDATNVMFANGKAEKWPGFSAIHTASGDVTELAQAYVDSQKRIYWGEATRVGVVADGVPNTLGTGLGGGLWSFEPWGEWLLATNNVDPPKIWKNVGALANWAGVPVSRAKIVRKLANFPLLFYGQEVAWPDLQNIENWEAGAESRAGGQFIRDLDSDIEAVEPIGELQAVYTQNRMALGQFVGGTSVFGFKTRLEGIGAVSRNAVIPVGQRHYGMSQDGIWVTDGSTFSYVDKPAVYEWLKANIDWLYANSIVGYHWSDQSIVVWTFRAKDASRKGIGYNYKNNSWGPLALNITAGSAQEAYENPILAAGTAIGMLGTDPDLPAATITSSLRSAPMDVGDPDTFKQWDMIRAHWKGSGVVEMRLGFSQTEQADPEWTEWEALAESNWLDPPRDSVFLTLELRSTAADVSWALGGVDVFGELTAWR